MQSCGGAPAEATIDRITNSIADQERLNPAKVTMPSTGVHTVTVPGAARGWEATVKRFGVLSFADILQPAINQAISGFPVSEITSTSWDTAESIFSDSSARDEYLTDDERAPQVGEVIQLEGLGGTLQSIAEKGADVIYDGRISDKIITEIQGRGGFMTKEDLSKFDPEFLDPISTDYHGAEIFELPPTNQGLIVLEALNIASEIDADSYSYESPERVHYFTEAMKRAFHDGHRYIADPSYENVPRLHDKNYAAERAGSISGQASDVTYGMPGNDGEYSDTTLLTVADSDGNLVSYINSLFGVFGSGIVAGDTGIILQNRGASFSLDPEVPNSLEPGKRPFHTLIPGLIRFNDTDWAAFGVMGGYMQPQGHLQILSNLIDYNLPLQRALDEPRWRYLEEGELALEARFDANLQTKLVRRGHNVTINTPSHFGGGQIARIADGVLSAATDPRKDGAAIGY